MGTWPTGEAGVPAMCMIRMRHPSRLTTLCLGNSSKDAASSTLPLTAMTGAVFW